MRGKEKHNKLFSKHSENNITNKIKKKHRERERELTRIWLGRKKQRGGLDSSHEPQSYMQHVRQCFNEHETKGALLASHVKNKSRDKKRTR